MKRYLPIKSDSLASDERGAVLAIGAVGIMAIIIVAALVVDLGSARVDRAENQVVTDAAAAAGVVGLVNGTGQTGCDAAAAYVESHLGTIDGISCGGFPIDCDDLTAPATATGTVGDRVITITYPIDDTGPLMNAGSNSAPTQSASDGDGDRCDRLGVRIQDPRATFFAAVTGGAGGTTSVHSVARISDEFGRNLIVNMLLLEQTDCEALTIGGGGSSGGISVASVTDPETGDIYPGRIALDSDGTGANCGSRGTIHANGSGATIHADGPPGCTDELAPGGFGCGRIETYASGTPGCNLPACSSAGVIAPPPTQIPRRLTRAPIDWQYNCKSAYPVALGIPRCPDSATRGAYIDNLVYSVGAFTDFDSYRGAGFKCQINGGGAPVVVPEGNWLVDCDDLRVGKELTFEGGNIIFEGDVSVGSQGHLRINTNNTATYSWAEGLPFDYTLHSANAAFVYFLDGTLSKGGGSSLELSNTMGYFSPTSELQLGGGSGSMIWTAPLEGPFANLALWSDSSNDHGFAGSATLTLEGIIFTPNATIVFTGNGGQSSVEAQFIARKASVQGNGSLRLAPKWNSSIKHPPPAISELIR